MMLYAIPISSYCNKVLLAMQIKGVVCSVKPPPGGYGSEEYKRIVPSGTIPALCDGNLVLTESEVINEYLNEIHPDPNLLPGSPSDRASIRILCRFHDLKLEPTVRSLFPAMNPSRRDLESVRIQCVQMEKQVTLLNKLVLPNPFLGAASITLADCAFMPTLMLAGLIWKELGIPLELGPRLEAWQKQMESLPEVQKVLEPARQAGEKWLDSKRQCS